MQNHLSSANPDPVKTKRTVHPLPLADVSSGRRISYSHKQEACTSPRSTVLELAVGFHPEACNARRQHKSAEDAGSCSCGAHVTCRNCSWFPSYAFPCPIRSEEFSLITKSCEHWRGAVDDDGAELGRCFCHHDNTDRDTYMHILGFEGHETPTFVGPSVCSIIFSWYKVCPTI